MEQIEKIARAYRDTMYGTPIEDNSWESCKEHWIKDTKAFLAKLTALGLEITDKLINKLPEANELLRSAHEIAQRKGEHTNWEAFQMNLRRELLRQAGRPGDSSEQIILRATCTPKTYRLPPDAIAD